MKYLYWGLICTLALVPATASWSATANTANNPTFLVIDACSNGWENLSSNTLDIGVDIGANGSYDYWLSQDTLLVKSGPVGNKDAVGPANWRTIVVNLDAYAGETAKIKIVDNSTSYYMAINSIRLNNADGTAVPNGVPNGSFENATALSGWTVTGSQTATQLLKTDTALAATNYETKYIDTGIAGTATIESNSFVLTPVSSFIHGIFGGPVSSKWDKPGASGSDNNLYVFIDVGTASQDPNGQYDAGTDIPLYGFYYQNADGAMEVWVINTSGFEGRRARVTAIDRSATSAFGLDGIRMNWDNSIIRNGGFEEGFEEGFPEGFQGTSVRASSEHPSGKIPGWNVTQVDNDPDSDVTYYGVPNGGTWSRSDLVCVGSSAFFDGTNVPDLQVEFRSDVFVIQPIPSPADNVFLSFNSGQYSTRIDAPPTDTDPGSRCTVELQVDVTGNSAFDDAGDFIYREVNQGASWAREQFGEVDEWHYPDYRFYIAAEHQGKQGRLYAEDTNTGAWAWMAVDDFYFWNGATAALAFANSDFEAGSLTNWNEENLTPTQFTSWLSTQPNNINAVATHKIMNGIVSWPDGLYAADSAQDIGGSGDNAEGKLWSNAFTIPTKAGTRVSDWALF